MSAVEKLFLEAQKLPVKDRRALLYKLQDELDESGYGVHPLPPLEERQREAMAYFSKEPSWSPPSAFPSSVELLREDRQR